MHTPHVSGVLALGTVTSSGKIGGTRSSRTPKSNGGLRLPGGLLGRVLIAIPWVAFAIIVVTFGSWVWTITVGCFAVLALHELFALLRDYRPFDLVGYVGALALIAAAMIWGLSELPPVLAASLAAVLVLALARRDRKYVTVSMAVTLLGIVWIGFGLAHAVLLRELSHGAGLIVVVLAATFIGDTFAYLGGRLYGRTPLVPSVSPNKTYEGLFAGIIGSIAAASFAGLYQDWITSAESVILGLGIAAAAPLGDLFESLIKRDLAVKDSGSFFGVHGGVLDRLDAVLFTAIVGYYIAKAMLFT